MAKVDCSELAKTITQLAMNIASREGVNNLDDVLRKIQEYFPQMRREDLVGAIVEATTGQNKKADALMAKLSRIKKEAKTDKLLNKKIEELQNYLDTGEIPPNSKRNAKEPSDAIRQLREIVADLKTQAYHGEPAQSDRIEKQIKDLEKRISEGDIFPKARITKTIEDKELAKLYYKRDKLRNDIQREVYRLKPKKIWEKAVEPFNTIRAILTTGEFSGVLRQGGFIAFGNPVRAAQALPDMFKSLVSAQSAHEISQSFEDRDNAPLYARSGLYLAPIEGLTELSPQEEAMMGRWLHKIPLVENFARSYSIFLNRLRADSFDAMAATLGINGEVTQKEAEAIARFVNEATGRGGLGSWDKAAVGLNTVFFAPRYTTSRFQLLVGHPLWGGTGRTRRLIAKEYAKTIIGMGAVYALGMLAGGDIETDPRSPDFGKIKFGNTRIDPMFGLLQSTVLISRLVSGKTKRGSGQVVPIRGDKVPYGGTTTFDVMANFLRTKLSPTIGIPVDIITGKDVVGQPVTPQGLAAKTLTPITYGDIYDAMKEQGAPAGAALGLLSVFGMGLQTYETKKPKSKNKIKY